MGRDLHPGIRRTELAPLAGAVLLPLVVGLAAHSQGFNLLDDGIWLLGGRTLAEGKLLYRDLFTLYGPARFLLLLPPFLLFGKSALALAVLKALLDALASGVGFLVARRLGAGRLAWLVPLGVLALGPLDPRYVATGLFAIGVGKSGEAPLRPDRALRIGIWWGLLAWFGLDAALFGLIILGASCLLVPGLRPDERTSLRVLLGFLMVVLAAFVPALVSGTIGDAVWQTVIFPLSRFGDSMRLSWLRAFADPQTGLRPFAEVFTGEQLTAAYPLHAPMRVFAVRALYLGLWALAPLAIVGELRAARRPLVLALGLFAATGMLTLLGRGDVVHLKSAWLGSLWLLPVVLAQPRISARVRPIIVGAICLLVLFPLAIEPLWLMAHASRPTLAAWARPTARIRTGVDTIRETETLFKTIAAAPQSPMVIWPAYPGLHALMDVPPACRYVTLLTPGEVRDPGKLFARLEAARPEYVLVGFSGYTWLSSGMSLGQLEPQIWTYLRRHYRVDRVIVGDILRFKVLRRVPEGAQGIRKLPLMEQLNDREFTAWNGASPPLTPGTDIGQSFQAGDLGFSGIGVSFRGTAGDTLSVRLAVWAQKQGGEFSLLGTTNRDIVLRENQDFQYVSTGAIPNTSDRTLIVTFELMRPPSHPASLLWYRHGAGDEDPDFCPDGSVYIRKQPVDADLYFLSY